MLEGLIESQAGPEAGPSAWKKRDKPPVPARVGCLAAGCGAAHYSMGLCDLHYSRWPVVRRRTGITRGDWLARGGPPSSALAALPAAGDPSAGGPGDLSDKPAKADRLAEFLAPEVGLSADERALICMRFGEGAPLRTIAKRLGLTPARARELYESSVCRFKLVRDQREYFAGLAQRDKELRDGLRQRNAVARRKRKRQAARLAVERAAQRAELKRSREALAAQRAAWHADVARRKAERAARAKGGRARPCNGPATALRRPWRPRGLSRALRPPPRRPLPWTPRRPARKPR